MCSRLGVVLATLVFLTGCSGVGGGDDVLGSFPEAKEFPADESTSSVVSSVVPSPGTSVPALPSPTARTLAALGDSFASGVGASGTTASCGRSMRGWTGILAADLGMDFVNLACSGATLPDTIRQVADLPANVDVVAITSGGNSLKFSQVVTLCLGGDCEAGWKAALSNRARIRPDTVELLERIHAARPDITAVVLTLYPAPTTPGLTCGRVTEEVGELFAEGAVLLNTELRAAAEDARSAGVPVVVVDPVAFADHTLCTSSPWFHGFEKGLLVMHLNDDGYEAMADAAMEAMLSASK